MRACRDWELPLPHRSTTRAPPRHRGRGRGAGEGVGSPYLAVEAEGHGLVLQRHEEGAAVQLVLQVQHHGVDWGRGSVLGQGQRFGTCSHPSTGHSPVLPPLQVPSGSHRPHPTQHRATTTFPQTLSPSQGSFAARMPSSPPGAGFRRAHPASGPPPHARCPPSPAPYPGPCPHSRWPCSGPACSASSSAAAGPAPRSAARTPAAVASRESISTQPPPWVPAPPRPPGVTLMASSVRPQS